MNVESDSAGQAVLCKGEIEFMGKERCAERRAQSAERSIKFYRGRPLRRAPGEARQLVLAQGR